MQIKTTITQKGSLNLLKRTFKSNEEIRKLIKFNNVTPLAVEEIKKGESQIVEMKNNLNALAGALQQTDLFIQQVEDDGDKMPAEKEFALNMDNIEKLFAWDFVYYQEKLKEEKFGIKKYETYQEFAKKVYKIRGNVRKYSLKLKNKNTNIVG